MNPLRRTVRPLISLAALAVALPVLGAVAPAPAAVAETAAPGDEVIAWAEVEDGVISGGPALNSGDHGNFSGTGSYTFREAGMTSAMTVTAPEAGTYPIYIRYAAGPLSAEENVTRSMGLLTNGGDRQILDYPMTSFQDWEDWDFVAGEVTLEEGENTVAVNCERSLPTETCRLNFDAIQVGGTAPDPCLATPVKPGYRGLFDGTFESFDGWRKAGSGGFGRQTDCTIRTIRGRGATWFTEQQSAPYTLELDWRRNDSNDDSAVYLASNGRPGNTNGQPESGYKIPIGDSTGAVMTPGGAQQAADAAAVTAALRPVGEWNRYAIRLTGTELSVYLNGTLVNTVERDGSGPVAGFIGLENRSQVDTIDFKDIQIADVTTSTTSLSVSSAKIPVKKGTATVDVTVESEGATPTGDVELYDGDTLLTTVELVDGAASVEVGPFGAVGRRTLSAHYLGSLITEPSTSSAATVTVAKAATKLKTRVKPKRIVAKKTRAALTVAVSAPGLTPTGKVRVKVGGKTYNKALRGGKATIKLKRFAKAGKARATVTYLGSALTTKASGKVVLKVVKK